MTGIWRCVYLLISSLSLLFGAASTVEGCMCKRLHPQQQYCQAAFAVGGKVMKREYIRTDLGPRDEDEMVTTPSQQVDDTMTTVTMTTMDLTTTMPEETDSTNITSVQPSFLAGERRKAGKRNSDDGEGLVILSGPDGAGSELYNYNIIYTIKLSHIYKTSDEEEEWFVGKDIKLASPASPELCGVTELKNGKNYLFAGKQSGRIGLCDWVQEHHKLTSRQKQGLKSAYSKYCHVCQIAVCPSLRRCKRPKENRTRTCMYDAPQVADVGLYAYPDTDCLAAHSRCMLRGGRKCKWQKNNEYNDCLNSLP